jgi:hypothetical protein
MAFNPDRLAKIQAAAGDDPITIDEPKIDLHTTGRTKFCGKVFERASTSGRLTYHVMACGCWRTCERCLSARVSDLKQRGRVAFIDNRDIGISAPVIHRVGIIEFDLDETEVLGKLCTTLTSKNYLRLPTVNGYTLLVRLTPTTENNLLDAEAICNELTPDEVRNLDWRMLANTPFQKRVTGDLGKLPPLAEHEGLLVSMLEVSSNAPFDARMTAYTEAIEQDTSPEPTNDETLYNAMRARTGLYYEALVRGGYRVSCRSRRLKIKRSNNQDYIRFIPGLQVQDIVEGGLYGIDEYRKHTVEESQRSN